MTNVSVRATLCAAFLLSTNFLLADTQTRTVAGTVTETDWTNGANAASIDGACTFPEDLSPDPILLTNWGFTIPAGATINGISVTVRGASTAGSNIIQLIKGGTAQGSTFDAPISGGSCPGSTETVGSASELWGLAWTDADINAGNFGVSYDAEFQGRQFDGVEITVDFTPPTSQTRTVAGTISTSGWTNSANAASIDGACAFPTDGAASPPPILLTNWGFSIPPGATIHGITVTVRGASTAGEDIIRLIKGGTPQGSTFDAPISGGSCPGSTENVGGSSELWGLTWTDADINASNFGVSYDAEFAGRQFDGVSITVDFGGEPEVDIALSSTESIDPVVAGSGAGNLVQTITVTNNGPDGATGVEVTAAPALDPAGVTQDSAVPSQGMYAGGVWTVGSLANGASATLTFTFTVGASAPDGDTITRAMSVTAVNETDTEPGNDSTSVTTTIARLVDIALSSMESVDPVVAGSGAGNLVHTITATNNGPSVSSGVAASATITFPAGVNVDSVVASGSGSWSGTNPGTWTIGDLANGASETLTITFTVASSAAVGTDVIDTDANVSAVNETDSNPGNDTTLVETSIAREIDLTVTKTDDPDPVVAGLELNGLEYVVTVTNNGPSDGAGVVINDTQAGFPTGVVLESWVESAGTYDGTNWTVDLPASATETLTLVVTVGPATVPGDDVISNTATVTGSGGNEVIINTGDDSDTETTTVLPTTATWTINKDFLDDNASSVTATLTCTSGEVTGPVQVSEGNPGELTVERFLMGPFGSTTCEVTESNLPPEYFQVSASVDCEVEGVVHEDEFDCDFVNAPIQANFVVTKDFSDDNPANVRVVLECNTGLPLMQEAMVSEFGGPFQQIVFIVKDFQIGTLDCDVFEEPVPTGYAQSYAASADPIDALYGGLSNDAEGCHYSDIQTGTYNCEITDTLLPVDVTVNKQWIDDHPEYQLPTFVEVELECNAPILVSCNRSDGICDPDGPGGVWSVEEYIDPNYPLHVQVLPDWDGTTVCSATETPQAGVLIDESDCEAIPLAPGQDGECTIVNTRLFAGIPTLSQWGIMIMALMMLGIGLVAYRRFV